MADTVIVAQGVVKHEELPEAKPFKVEGTWDVPKSFEELTEKFSEKDILAGFTKSYVIAIQAEMRRKATREILEENGITPKGREALTPEQKALNSALGKMTKEQREAVLSQIKDIVQEYGTPT